MHLKNDEYVVKNMGLMNISPVLRERQIAIMGSKEYGKNFKKCIDNVYKHGIILIWRVIERARALRQIFLLWALFLHLNTQKGVKIYGIITN